VDPTTESFAGMVGEIRGTIPIHQDYCDRYAVLLSPRRLIPAEASKCFCQNERLFGVALVSRLKFVKVRSDLAFCSC
jgi:hypothetical protein